MRWHTIVPFAAIIFCLIVGGWFVTYGNGAFLADRDLYLGDFFDAQGDSLLHGRLDVPRETIAMEAFIVNGRSYGYFGITPSLFRLPLNALFPAYKGRWAPLSELAACALFLGAAFGFVREVRRAIFPECPLDSTFNVLSALFLVALGMGSTTIFLLSRPVVFHEVLIWSVALSLVSLLLIFKYWNRGGVGLLASANVFALLAMHTRPVAGCAALLACAVMPVLRYRSASDGASGARPFSCRGKEVIWGVLFVMLVFGSYLAVTYAKFGTFSGLPVKYHVQYNPQRLAAINGSMFHLNNVSWNMENYFGVAGWKLPFADNKARYIRECLIMSKRNHPEASIDGVEAFMSIPVALSALAILSLIGIAGCIRKGRKGLGMTSLSLSTLLGPVTLLFFVYISYRYYHEYLLWMSCAGAAGICVLRTTISRHKIFCLLLTLLLVVNITINVLFALLYQTCGTNVGPPIMEVKEKIEQWNSCIPRLGW